MKIFELFFQDFFADSKKKRTFALAIRNDANRFDSLAQQVEHNTFNVGVLGSSPKRITRLRSKKEKALIIKWSQSFFFFMIR